MASPCKSPLYRSRQCKPVLSNFLLNNALSLVTLRFARISLSPQCSNQCATQSASCGQCLGGCQQTCMQVVSLPAAKSDSVPTNLQLRMRLQHSSMHTDLRADLPATMRTGCYGSAVVLSLFLSALCKTIHGTSVDFVSVPALLRAAASTTSGRRRSSTVNGAAMYSRLPADGLTPQNRRLPSAKRSALTSARLPSASKAASSNASPR